MKIYFLLLIAFFSFAIQIFAESSTRNFQLNEEISTWERYRNKKYRYEILYPKRLKLLLTGPSFKRDGREFIIVYGDVALVHGLHMTLYPKKTIGQIARELKISDSEKIENGPLEYPSKDGLYIRRLSKIKLNGKDAIKEEYFQKSSESILSATYILNEVVFQVFRYFGNFDASIAERIISSFKFYKK